jgi:hypothetical protein
MGKLAHNLTSRWRSSTARGKEAVSDDAGLGGSALQRGV